MRSIIESLEFDKVLRKLANYAVTADAKLMCEKLSPIKNEKELKNCLMYLDKAVSLYNEGSIPEFTDINNTDNSIMRLEKNAALNIDELLNITKILKTADKFISYSKTKTNNVLNDYFNKLNSLKEMQNAIERVFTSNNEISDNASSVLNAIRKKGKLLEEKLHKTASKLLDTYGACLQEPVIADKDGSICLPVKSEFKNKIDGIVHSISSSQYTIFIEPKEISGINNEINENKALENVEIERILAGLSAKLTPYINEIKINYVTLVTLDFIFAKAKFATDTKLTLPLLNNEGIINLHNARHPLISKDKIVPLDIYLGEDFSTLIITGPNTGGKTVSLKTVGLIEMMAMSGLFIPSSENSKVAIFDNIYADIGDEQSIEMSLSTFSSHMTNIVNILKNATEKSLVLFDELCTGTDPVEGASLAISILNKLLNMKTRTIATTHYPELKKYALSKPGVKNGAFEFDVDSLKPTYKLIIGIPGKSNAFAISEKLGLDKNIINNAKSLLDTNDVRFEDIVASLEESRITIDRERKEIENYKNEITELKDKVKRQEKGLNDRADSIIRQAKEKAHTILFDAKEIADETIKKIKNADESLTEKIGTRSKLNKALSDATDNLIERVKGPSQPLSTKKIKIGATVRVLSLNATGVVESLPDKDYNLYVRIGILRSQVNLRDLELIKTDDIKIDGTKIKRTYDKTGSSKIKLEKSYTVPTEINLIGKTTDEAIFLLDKYIDDAYIAHLPEVRIIHGRGTGALKNAVTNYCKKSPIISEFRFGDYNEGGDGATIVKF